MNVLWDAGSATVAEVRERLSDDLAYTTVLTVLRTLDQKGYVAHIGAGRAPRRGVARGPRGFVPRPGGAGGAAGCLGPPAGPAGAARRRRTPGDRRSERPTARGRRAPHVGAVVLARRPRCCAHVGVGLFLCGAAAFARGRRAPVISVRSEERRVGKECRSRWSPYH